MDLELAGKVALVTGASRGLGRGIAGALAAEGVSLVTCARGRDELETAAEEARAAGVEVLPVALDLTDPEAPGRLVAAAGERFGRLDLVVGNVGGNRRKPLVETTDDDWRELLDLNLLSHVRTCRAAIPLLPDRRGARDGGVIVLVASIYGREASGPGLTLYNTTKSALISLAKVLSLELAPRGIRVLSVAPGSILFPGGAGTAAAARTRRGSPSSWPATSLSVVSGASTRSPTWSPSSAHRAPACSPAPPSPPTAASRTR